MLRVGLIVAFFRQGPFTEWAPQVAAVLDRFLATAPPEAIAYATVGASATRVRPVSARTLPRCRAELDPGKAAQREISSFELGGPEPVNPDWLLDVWGGNDAQGDRTNFVQLRLPTAWLDATGDNLMRLALDCAEALDFDSGYASLALHWSTDAELIRAAAKIPGIALRHPGLDLHHHKDLRFSLGVRCVGARWLTLLGPSLANALGGAAQLRAALPDSVDVQTIARGLAVRVAGPPLPGDVNLGDDLPDLRAVASALEPVTHFEAASKLLLNPDAHERWQRRFLDR